MAVYATFAANDGSYCTSPYFSEHVWSEHESSGIKVPFRPRMRGDPLTDVMVGDA
jgi:hypothetical protein